MELRFGELTDDHVFLTRVRSLVDWSFKLIAWLGICATIQIAAEKTGSVYLWVITIISYFLIFFFLQSFLDWVWHFKRNAKPNNTRARSRNASTSPARWVQSARKWMTFLFAGIVWFGLVYAQQIAVSKTISAIIEFQKSAGR